MNRIPIALAALLLAASAQAAELQRDLRFSTSDVTVRGAAGQARVRLRGAANRGLPGEPDLPWKTFTFEIPTGSRVVSWKAEALEWRDLGPTPRPRTPEEWRGQDGLVVATHSASAPAGGGWFPALGSGPAASGSMQGHSIAQCTLRPVQWNEAAGRLRLATRVRVTATVVEGAGSLPLARVRKTPLTEEATRRALGSLGVAVEARPNAVPGRGGAFPMAPGEYPGLLGRDAAYVIITSDSLVPYFQPLADWKARQGISSRIVPISTIVAGYPQGADLPEKVRLYLKDAFAYSGTQWVLLGGDASALPSRLVHSFLNGGDNIPSDSYFGNLDGNWDANGNSVFGQPDLDVNQPGDSVDFYPDIYVGRAPCSNRTDVNAFVNKTLIYDQTPPANFLENQLLFSEVLFPTAWTPATTIQLDGAVLSETVNERLFDTNHVVRLYENNDQTAYPGSYAETPQSVRDSLNVGYNLALHEGHGFRNSMSVGNGSLVTSDVRGLRNSPRNCFLVSGDCTSGAFDFDCIGSASINNPLGGAFAFWGSTREAYPPVSQDYLDGFFDLAVGDSSAEIGQDLALCKVPYVIYCQGDYADRWMQFTQVLLGDPGLRFRSHTARSLSAAYPATYICGSPGFAVTVTSGGLPEDSALVCVQKPGDDARAGYTNALGQVTLPFQPDTAGTFQVTVTHVNCLPFLGSGSLLSRSGPYLFDAATQKIVQDGSTLPQNGNGDSQVDAGETIQLGVRVQNGGGSAASGATGVLSPDSTGVTVSSGTVSYGTLTPHTSSFGTGRYVVQFSRSLRDGVSMPLKLHLTDAQGDIRDDYFRIAVRAPRAEQYAHVWLDSISGANHITVLKVTIRNIGSGPFRSLVGKVRPAFVGLTPLDSVSTYGSLTAGASAVGSAEYRFRGPAALSASNRFWLYLTDAYGHADTLGFSLQGPRPVTGLAATGTQNSITLTWNSSPDSASVAGYYIYRAPAQAGPFTRVNSRVTSRIAYFQDPGLQALTTYYYDVTAVDSAGNEGLASAVASGSTNPPIHGGWPITTGTELAGSPALVNFDHSSDGSLEIVQGSDGIYMWHPDGSEIRDGDNQPVTSGVWVKRGDTYPNSVVVSDFLQNGKYCVAAVSRDSDFVFVWDENGNVVPGWPQKVSGFPFGTMAVGDLEGNGHPDLILGCGPFIYAWRANGTEVRDGDSNPATNGVFAVGGGSYCYGSPAIADIDRDGRMDIVLGTGGGLLHALRWNGTECKGFPFAPGGAITGSPAVTDLDLDGHQEIIFPCTNNYLYCLTDTGTIRAGWPVSMRLDRTSRSPSPALADMDHDGYLDIVEGTTDGYLKILTRDGVLLPGWGNVRFAATYAAQSGATESSPVVADLRGDGQFEVLQGAEDATLYGFNQDGSNLAGFPIRVGAEIRGTPAVWDLTHTGKTNIVLACWDKKIYIWDYPGTFLSQNAAWPMFRHDDERSGHYAFNNSITGVEDALLTAEPGPQGIRVAWAPPTAAAGSLAWNLYRREDSGEKSSAAAPRSLASLPTDFLRVNAAPIRGGAASPTYLDGDVRGGHTYIYVLETLLDGRRASLTGPVVRGMPLRFLPAAASLAPNVPNPFGRGTDIQFMIPAGASGASRLSILDVSGRLVHVLEDAALAPGSYTRRWDGRMASGGAAPSGLYFCRLETSGRSFTRKMLLSR